MAECLSEETAGVCGRKGAERRTDSGNPGADREIEGQKTGIGGQRGIFEALLPGGTGS